MSWDLRSKYAFDATESQILEGKASPYGEANDQANCVPASFTAALDLAGFGDIDPQQVTNELYGPNFRDGYGTFDKMLGWIRANVPQSPLWTHSMAFDFAAADRAGEAGQLIVVAGWIDGPSVTFIPGPQPYSHASLLVAHQPDDSFVIWNTWLGQFQTYSRAVLAASLYEMAIMDKGDRMELITIPRGDIATYSAAGRRHIVMIEWGLLGAKPPDGYGLVPRMLNQQQWDAIPEIGTFTLSPADEKLLQEAHDQIAALLAAGGLSAASAQQLQEAHDTVMVLAKTGTLTPAQDQALKEAHDIIVKDLK